MSKCINYIPIQVFICSKISIVRETKIYNFLDLSEFNLLQSFGLTLALDKKGFKFPSRQNRRFSVLSLCFMAVVLTKCGRKGS